VPQPLQLPAPPLIRDLGQNENPAIAPVAWSCGDILSWNSEFHGKKDHSG